MSTHCGQGQLHSEAAGMDPAGYSGHCFRIGESIFAVFNELGVTTIQILRHWSHDRYARYIHLCYDE